MTREVIVRPIFQQPNGYWWAYSMIQPDRIYSLHTRDMSKAQAAYNEQLDRLRRYAGSNDPAGDAGMDNPPEPEVAAIEVLRMQLGLTLDRAKEAEARAGELDRRLILAWKTIGDLERERDEALAKTYKRAAEEITLDIEAGYAASVYQVEALQQRVKELEAALELRWADIAHLDTKLADTLDRAEQVEAQCAEWPRCACGRGGPDLCAERGT